MLDPAHLTADQPNFDAVGVIACLGQYVLDHTASQTAGSLVLLQNDIHLLARPDIFSIISIHRFQTVSDIHPQVEPTNR